MDYTLFCEYCGKEFVPEEPSDVYYCSAECEELNEEDSLRMMAEMVDEFGHINVDEL